MREVMRTAYHLTDDPEFAIDPNREVLGRPDPERGTQRMTGVIYLTETPHAWATCGWISRDGARTFIAEIEWDPTGDEHETTYTRRAVPAHEVLVDATRAHVVRVIPA